MTRFLTSTVALILTVSFTVTVAHGQTTFQKTYGGSYNGTPPVYHVQQTNDSGYVLIGTPSDTMTHIQLIKTSSYGSRQWTKTFSRSGWDFGKSVKQTSDNGFIICGDIYSQSPQQDVLLMKTNSNGNIQWAKSFGGGLSDLGEDLQQTNDGGFIIVGSTSSFGAGNYDVYLVKTASDGSLQWIKTFGTTNEEQGHSIQQTNDGGYIITGSTGQGAGSYDVYLLKTDSMGSLQWSKSFGGTYVEYGYSVQQTNDDGFIIGGITRSFGSGSRNFYLVKTASDGSLQWSKTFGGTYFENSPYVQQTIDGGFIITGYTTYTSMGNTDIYLIKADSTGSLQWSKTFGGTDVDEAFSIRQTNDNGFIIAGSTTNTSLNSSVVYLIKTDSNGISGCNEINPTTIVTTPATIVTNIITQVSSGGVIGNPSFQTDSIGVETTLCLTIGISESNLIDNFVNIFPNPFSSQTTLQTNVPLINATLTVYNCFGQQVKQINNINGQSVTLMRDNLPSGLYFLRLTEENKTIAVDKLVITDK